MTAADVQPAAFEQAGVPSGPLVDPFARAITYLRVSVTDRCDFRCVYCMPKEIFGRDYQFLPRRELLTFEEIARLAGVFRALGVRHHFFPGTMSYLDCLGHLFFAQFLHIEVAKHVAHPSSGHELDPVSSVFQVSPYCRTDFLHIVSNIGPPRQSLIGRQKVDVAVSS